MRVPVERRGRGGGGGGRAADCDNVSELCTRVSEAAWISHCHDMLTLL